VIHPFGPIACNVIQIVVAQFRKYGRGNGPDVLPVSWYLIPFHWYDPEEEEPLDTHQSLEKIFTSLGLGNEPSLNLSGL
jgi:hypothetical protein